MKLIILLETDQRIDINNVSIIKWNRYFFWINFYFQLNTLRMPFLSLLLQQPENLEATWLNSSGCILRYRCNISAYSMLNSYSRRIAIELAAGSPTTSNDNKENNLVELYYDHFDRLAITITRSNNFIFMHTFKILYSLRAEILAYTNSI